MNYFLFLSLLFLPFQIRKLEGRASQVLGRLEQCEGQLREKEKEIEIMKTKLAAHPDTHREREWAARIEEGLYTVLL